MTTGAELYAQLKPKQRRILEADVATLFSRAAFLDHDIENLRKYGLWRPHIERKGNWFYLSDRGISARRRLQETVARVPELALVVSKGEISAEIAASHARFTERTVDEGLVPEGNDFFIEVAGRLLASVKSFTFVAIVDGLRLDDVAAFNLASACVHRSDRQVFEKVQFEGGLPLDAVYKHFEGRTLFTARVRGSPDVAVEKFRYRASITVGILALCGTVTHRGAFWRTRVRVIAPSTRNDALLTLRWEDNGVDPTLTRTWGDAHDLPIAADSLAYANKECFFQQLAALPDLDSRGQLQDAILSSLYWFADAYSDPNPTMKFVKLWSCMESFFSIEKEGVTDLNAKGIAAVLTYAGYNVTSPAEYLKLKARLKKMYGMRSEVVHGRRVGHIEMSDIDAFSRWVVWTIISMAALSDRGIQTLKQVQENVSRLDALHVAAITDTPKELA